MLEEKQRTNEVKKHIYQSSISS